MDIIKISFVENLYIFSVNIIIYHLLGKYKPYMGQNCLGSRTSCGMVKNVNEKNKNSRCACQKTVKKFVTIMTKR